MSILELREKYGYAPEWHDDKEFPHELWKEAFRNLVNGYAAIIEEYTDRDSECAMDIAHEEAYESFTNAWYSYKASNEEQK